MTFHTTLTLTKKATADKWKMEAVYQITDYQTKGQGKSESKWDQVVISTNLKVESDPPLVEIQWELLSIDSKIVMMMRFSISSEGSFCNEEIEVMQVKVDTQVWKAGYRSMKSLCFIKKRTSLLRLNVKWI